MRKYEDLVKDRDALSLKIQEFKMQAEAPLTSDIELAAILTTLASLRIQYAEIQRKIINYYSKKR